MRYIFPRSAEPALLAEDRRDGRRYKHLRTETKVEIRRLRRADQYGLCGFCCRNLPDDERFQRIAHVVPRQAGVQHEVDFGNMVLSCSGIPEEPKEPTCDITQGARRLAVHPMNPDCETRLHFDFKGAVQPMAPQDRGARDTIAALHLDAERLRQARKTAIDIALTDLEVNQASYSASLVGGSGRVYEFAPVIERVLGRRTG